MAPSVSSATTSAPGAGRSAIRPVNSMEAAAPWTLCVVHGHPELRRCGWYDSPTGPRERWSARRLSQSAPHPSRTRPPRGPTPPVRWRRPSATAGGRGTRSLATHRLRHHDDVAEGELRHERPGAADGDDGTAAVVDHLVGEPRSERRPHPWLEEGELPPGVLSGPDRVPAVLGDEIDDGSRPPICGKASYDVAEEVGHADLGRLLPRRRRLAEVRRGSIIAAGSESNSRIGYSARTSPPAGSRLPPPASSDEA